MENGNKIPLVSIVGPTASGKTALSIEIAKLFDGEIVSADSMQIYKGMDVATAKPSLEEQQGIKHHLISFLDDVESFSVAQYCKLAHAVIADIHSRGKLPVMVGGTGLYVDSVINNTKFSKSESDPELRAKLLEIAENGGVGSLLGILESFDSDMARKLSVEKNVKRIIRAIEVYKVTGITMTEHNKQSHNDDSPYKVVKIGLTATDRDYLYDRINKRVDIMVNNGLVEEAQLYLSQKLSDTASMAIGHKELIPYINGETDLSACIDTLKMQTRRYAKRQLTWFRRDVDINWFNIDEICIEELIDQTTDVIKKVLFDET